MKQLILKICFLLISLCSSGQTRIESQPVELNERAHSFGDMTVFLSPDVLYPSQNGVFFAGGFKIRIFMGKRVSFDSDLLVGRNFLQLAPGLLGIPMFLFAGNEEDDQSISDFLMSILIVVLSAEHFAWHIPVRNADVSPYLSFLRYRQFERSNYEKDVSSLCFGAGLELNKYFKRFVLSPYADYTAGYSHSIHGFTIGVNCGYFFHVNR